MTDRLTGISSMATRTLLSELAQSYAQRTGVNVAIESVGGVDAARRVLAGEAFDFVVLASEAIDKLIAAGHVVAGSKVDVARSGVAIAVRAGAARPAVDTEQAVREAVRAARSVGYSTGPSGVALAKLFERWGIAEEISDRIVQAPPGVPVASLVAKGDVALGFQQLSELLNVEGIEVLGALPQPIQVVTIFSAGICHASTHAGPAKDFLTFLQSPHSEQAKRREGMEPAHLSP